jgi:beta-glucosidase
MLSLLSMPEIKFPENFLWGAGTAGHQIEGNNIFSQYWHDEQNGKYPTASGKACNHWELFREDAKLISELGLQAYRMSVEWARIEPQEGVYDTKALARYCEFMDILKEGNIKIFITLHHFTHPQWFEKKGGFRKRENIKYFASYIEYLIPKITRYTDGWNVINEFNGQRGLEYNDFKANMLLAHAKGYHIIKQHSKAPVSTAHALVDWHPRSYRDKFDKTTCSMSDWLTNEFFFHAIRTGEIVLPYRDVEFHPELKGAMDFWAMNYYTRHFVSGRSSKLEAERFSCNKINMIDEDFYLDEMYPEGMLRQLERMKDYPVYITENGCSCDDDRLRIIYITRYLHTLHEAIKRGVDVRGYFYWSLLDNYEWGSFKPRFGLVHVDFDSFLRTPKKSSEFYRDIIKNNGISLDLKDKFTNSLCNLKAYV